MPFKKVTKEDFNIGENEVTHVPTGKNYRAYPGRVEIADVNIVDLGDYHESDIREVALKLLAERLGT
jgi:hypothetical protein